MNSITDFLIPVALLIVQFNLSKSHITWLGAIVPTLYSALMIYYFAIDKIDVSFVNVSVIVIGLIMLLDIWAKGHQAFKVKVNKELEKMKLQDIR